MNYPSAMTTNGQFLTHEQYTEFVAEQRKVAQKMEDDRKTEAWTHERRDFWKSICMNMLTASVVRMGDGLDLMEVKKAAKQALTWFDEEFGGDYPMDVEKVFKK